MWVVDVVRSESPTPWGVSVALVQQSPYNLIRRPVMALTGLHAAQSLGILERKVTDFAPYLRHASLNSAWFSFGAGIESMVSSGWMY